MLNVFRKLSFGFNLYVDLCQVVAKKYRNYEIPAELTAVWRYLQNAYSRDEVTNTCAADREIELAYLDVAKRLK